MEFFYWNAVGNEWPLWDISNVVITRHEDIKTIATCVYIIIRYLMCHIGVYIFHFQFLFSFKNHLI